MPYFKTNESLIEVSDGWIVHPLVLVQELMPLN